MEVMIEGWDTWMTVADSGVLGLTYLVIMLAVVIFKVKMKKPKK